MPIIFQNFGIYFWNYFVLKLPLRYGSPHNCVNRNDLHKLILWKHTLTSHMALHAVVYEMMVLINDKGKISSLHERKLLVISLSLSSPPPPCLRSLPSKNYLPTDVHAHSLIHNSWSFIDMSIVSLRWLSRSALWSVNRI